VNVSTNPFKGAGDAGISLPFSSIEQEREIPAFAGMTVGVCASSAD